jgi:Flp pilus assembly protein TadD
MTAIASMARSSRLVRLALPIAAALLIAGCQSGKSPIATHGGVTVTGSTNLTDAQIGQAAAAWGKRYDADPKDRTTILNYAAALRLNGQTDQAVAVLRKGVIAFPKDYEVASAYGKSLAANGNFEQALNVIRDAQRADRPDWRLYSAEGAILDQMGRTAEARDRYGKALTISPGEPTILNNMALSHLLAGELPQAEQLLRQASQAPNANSRIRQNLALVLGLQGRFPEAEQIARNEMDPAQAEANVAYLKAMLAQANTWQQIKAGDKKQG